MQKITNILLRAAAAILATTLAAACVFEKEDPSRTEQQKYKYVLVQLGVNTDRMTATKADGDVTGADDDAGIPAETAIKDLRVYAYTNDGENGAKVLRGYFHAQNVDAAATATQPLLMDIKVPFEEYGTTKQVYFMAVANAGGMTGTDGIIINSIGRDPQTGALVLPDTFGFGEFADIIYSVADQTFANGMPMYCQTSAAVEVNLGAAGTTSTEPGHNGHTKLPVQVTLDMTRSLSKIEVYAAEDAGQGTSGESNAEIQITGVELMNVIADGPLFPAAASTTKLTTNPTLAGNAVALAASATDKADPSKYTKITDAYYLAENAAGTTGKFYYGETTKDADLATEANGATALKIGYKVGTNGEEKFGYVIMPPIERNTWYKVLARITAGGQMTLTLKVLPWTDTEPQIIDFADNVSLNGDITWSGNGTYAGSTFTYGSTNANAEATCGFIMDTPKGGTWYATLTEGDINSFVLETTVGETTTSGSTVSGPIVPGQQIAVKVRTTASNYLAGTKTVHLQITAMTADGRTLVVRHGTGDAAQDAYFTIVQPQNQN